MFDPIVSSASHPVMSGHMTLGESWWKCKAQAHMYRAKPREQWASTGNSFKAVLLTKASEWEQSKKECNVYGVCVIWGSGREAYVKAITTLESKSLW